MGISKKLKTIVATAAALSMSMALLLPLNSVKVNAETSDNSGESSSIRVERVSGIDTGRDGTLTVEYIFQDTGAGTSYPTPGVTVHMYKVADIDALGRFTLVAPFDNAISASDLKDAYSIATQDQWNIIINKLSAYINNNNIPATKSGVADADGEAKLGTVSLGLYLGLSDELKYNEKYYQYYPFLTTVPALPVSGAEEGREAGMTWDEADYNVIVSPKREVYSLDDPAEYKVYKQWDDNNYENRPQSITVNIFCDGAQYQSVQLSNENNWQYGWSYAKGHTFSVEEILDSDLYAANIIQNEETFIIVNKLNPQEEDKPPKEDTPPDDEGGKTPPRVDSPPDTTEGDTPPLETPSVLGAMRRLLGELPEVLGARRLPQTGQLWWPIPFLAIVGTLFIVCGIRSEKRRKDNQDM